MNGRRDDVGRMLPGQLDDVLAEITLEHTQAGRLEMVIQGNLLGDHGLALGHTGALVRADDRQDRVTGRDSIFAIMDLSPT